MRTRGYSLRGPASQIRVYDNDGRFDEKFHRLGIENYPSLCFFPPIPLYPEITKLNELIDKKDIRSVEVQCFVFLYSKNSADQKKNIRQIMKDYTTSR